MILTEASEIIDYISNSEKKTPVKITLKLIEDYNFNIEHVKEFGTKELLILIGDLKLILPKLTEQQDNIVNIDIEYDRQNSAVALLDITKLNARIEPGAVIRDHVTIGDNAVIMMGAVINIGSVIGEKTMIDMGAILGGRVKVGKNSHIGAGAVLAGVIEPPSATPVTIGDDVLIGANAVVLEGVQIGNNSVVAAGSVVISDVEANTVVAGSPAKFIKSVDAKTTDKTQILEELRQL